MSDGVPRTVESIIRLQGAKDTKKDGIEDLPREPIPAAFIPFWENRIVLASKLRLNLKPILCFLGTHGKFPTAEKFGNSSVITSDDIHLLFKYVLKEPKFSDITKTVLLEAILKEKPIDAIVLQESRLGSNEILLLCEILKTNPTIEALVLTSNNIGDKGVQYIAELLKVNRRINDLALGDNSITDQGMRYLMEAYKENSNLIELRLEENKISSQGAGILAIAIASNPNLKLSVLHLRGNPLGDDGLELLLRALNKKADITQFNLDIGYNYLSDVSRERLRKFCEDNPKITVEY